MRKVHGSGSLLGSGWLSNKKSLLHEKEKFISYLGISIFKFKVTVCIFFCKIVCTSCMSSAISLHTNICLGEGGGGSGRSNLITQPLVGGGGLNVGKRKSISSYKI